MTLRRNIIFACTAALLLVGMARCGKLDELTNTAREKIVSALNGQGVYERDNLPEDSPPTPDRIKGWFDMVDGAFRHVVNEDRADRSASPVITAGDSIKFMFDARIFTSGNFENQKTFYTNIPGRIKEVAGNNPDFAGWPEDPLRIKVGDDPRILKSLQRALISCRAGYKYPKKDDEEENNDPGNGDEPDPDDEEQEDIPSDVVRVYLTPDIAFGNKPVGSVPRGSTIVFEVTDIEIIK